MVSALVKPVWLVLLCSVTDVAIRPTSPDTFQSTASKSASETIVASVMHSHADANTKLPHSQTELEPSRDGKSKAQNDTKEPAALMKIREQEEHQAEKITHAIELNTTEMDKDGKVLDPSVHDALRYTGGGTVYRALTRADILTMESAGIYSRGTNDDILRHVMAADPTSNWISTSWNKDMADGWAQKSQTVTVAIDLAKVHDDGTPMVNLDDQNVRAAIFGTAADYIQGRLQQINQDRLARGEKALSSKETNEKKGQLSGEWGKTPAGKANLFASKNKELLIWHTVDPEAMTVVSDFVPGGYEALVAAAGL